MATLKDESVLTRSDPEGNSDLLDYYDKFSNSEVADGFQNLDDSSILEGQMQKARNPLTRDFVVAYNDEDAYAAFDLSLEAYTELLDAEQPPALSARWINIWYPFQHRPLLELLGKRYDFSPRLLGLMGASPIPARRPSVSTQSHLSRPQERSNADPAFSTDGSQAEKGPDELTDNSSLLSYDSVVQGNLYRLVNEIWHYTSVDFGRNYICLGYNSLYGVAPVQYLAAEDCDHLPNCTRIWTWLVLCDDGTVISISEDLFPQAQGRFSKEQLLILAETRRNLTSVFRSLSTVGNDPLQAKDPMAILPLRTRLGSTPEETVHRENNAHGLLFYYLFENWHNSYTLITRKESRYGVEFERLRKEMFVRPQLAHIDRLHCIGQELGVLKRHYESYNRMIDRILEPRPLTAASLQNSRVASNRSETSSLDTIRALIAEPESSLGVSLNTATRVRFKRLKDLIELYALSEVEEYLRQKDSLTSLVRS